MIRQRQHWMCPPEIELMSVNGTVTTSLAELAMAIEEIVPGAVAEIEYRIPGETDQRSTEITAGIRPATVTELSDVVLEQIQKSRPSTVVDGVAADAAEPAVESGRRIRKDFNKWCLTPRIQFRRTRTLCRVVVNEDRHCNARCRDSALRT